MDMIASRSKRESHNSPLIQKWHHVSITKLNLIPLCMYLFDFQFCSVDDGHTKGRCEKRNYIAWYGHSVCMMTPSNGNIFRVTGPLREEFTSPGEFPTQRSVTRSFDVFFDLRLNGCVNSCEAGDLRRHRGHYDVNVMDPNESNIWAVTIENSGFILYFVSHITGLKLYLGSLVILFSPVQFSCRFSRCLVSVQK